MKSSPAEVAGRLWQSQKIKQMGFKHMKDLSSNESLLNCTVLVSKQVIYN